MAEEKEAVPRTSRTGPRTKSVEKVSFRDSDFEPPKSLSKSIDNSPSDSEKTLYSNDMSMNTGNKSSTSKRKRRRQQKKNDSEGKVDCPEDDFPDDGVMTQLEMLDDSEVIKSDKKSDIFTITNQQGMVRSSKTSGKVYLEVRGGFKAVDQMKLMQSRLPLAFPKKELSVSQNSTVQEAAVGVQAWFRRLATVCHGLLAGLALCQALTVWLLAPPHHTWQDFVEHYTHIAYPFYATSHFLLIICVISVFDRFDVCKFQWQAIRERLGCGGLELLTLLLYPLALGLALMGADRDIRLGLFHKTNSTSWWEDRQSTENELEQWKLLILIKCVAVFIGWFLFGMHPTWDQFFQRLKGLKEP